MWVPSSPSQCLRPVFPFLLCPFERHCGRRSGAKDGECGFSPLSGQCNSAFLCEVGASGVSSESVFYFLRQASRRYLPLWQKWQAPQQAACDLRNSQASASHATGVGFISASFPRGGLPASPMARVSTDSTLPWVLMLALQRRVLCCPRTGPCVSERLQGQGRGDFVPRSGSCREDYERFRFRQRPMFIENPQAQVPSLKHEHTARTTRCARKASNRKDQNEKKQEGYRLSIKWNRLLPFFLIERTRESP